MTDDQIHGLLTQANPLTAERAGELEIGAAQAELLAGVIAEPELGSPQPRQAPRRRLFARVGLAVAATAAVLVVLLSLGDDSSDRGSGTAWAAEQIRFAEASPLVLLDAPGWRVDYADEQSLQDGELHFRLGPSEPPEGMTVIEPGPAKPMPADTKSATLHWRGGPIRTWLEDRAASATATTTAPVLGTTARVYQYEGGTPGHRDITALFRYDGRVLEFRAGAADLEAFRALLARLVRVDTDTWLSAMPASVVKAQDRDGVIKQMLQGVTLPPGFDPKDIKGPALTKDRYQLGAAVAGTVACQWFKLWAEGRRDNDRERVRQAIAAMAGARGWPILQEMKKEGDYPEVLFEFAAAMPSGDWYGRPLTGDVNSGLGCDGLGVDLP